MDEVGRRCPVRVISGNAHNEPMSATVFPPNSDQTADAVLRRLRAISGHAPFRAIAWLMYPKLRAGLAGRAESPLFGGRLMPSAGIPLRPSFVRSIHACIARPRPFTRLRSRRGRQCKPPRPKFSPSVSGRCRAADSVALRSGASLSIPAGPHRCRLSSRRVGRPARPPDGSVVVGAAWSAIHR